MATKCTTACLDNDNCDDDYFDGYYFFDENYDDKQEFVVATNLTTAGSAEDKLRWAFRMYDKDGSGKLN